MLDLEPRAQPPAGSVTPADLYVDRASRQLWLGVDVATDPSGSLLVSDVVQTLELIDQAELDAKAYTDTQVMTRALTVHTHTASQITDFNAAVANAIASTPGLDWITGMIVQWSGPLSEIGVGALAGWALCNGASHTMPVSGIFVTPDLRDRFIIGAGTLNPKDKNTAADLVTDTKGSHAHSGQTDPTTLTMAQMPAHAHSVSGSFSGVGSGSTDTRGEHRHTAGEAVLSGAAGGAGVRSDQGFAVPKNYTSYAGDHAHSVSVSVSGSISGTAATQGSGAGHSHPLQTDGSHNHSMTPANVRASIPWFALAYIIKLPPN